MLLHRFSRPVASLTLLLGAVLLAGCGPQGGKASGAGAAGEILVGEYNSLTGSEATFGQSSHKGIQLAIDEVNTSGGVLGRRIKLITYDTRGNSSEAGNAVTRLITQDNVVALLGEFASSLSLAGGAVAQKYGVPMISPGSTKPQVTQLGDKIFRVCFIDPFQGYVGAKFIREHLKLGKAAVFYDQTQAYSKGLKDDFVRAFQQMGGELLSEQSYSGGDQDFNAQLTTIRGTNPEVIYLPGYYNDVANIIVQARRLGITAPFVGGDGWTSEKFTQIGGAAVEGCYFSNHFSEEDQRPEVQEFLRRFKARFNETPDAIAALGYDAAHLLADALRRAGSTDSAALTAAIGQTKDFPGVTGKITLDADRNARKLAVVLQIQNGKPRFVTKVEP